MPRLALSAQTATYLVSCVLAGTAVTLWARAEPRTLFTVGLPGPVVVISLIMLFLLAEQAPLIVEFRSQAHVLTVAGVPIALTILLAPGHYQVPLRVGVSLAALLIQRIRFDKIVFNLASYAFDIAIGQAVVSHLLGTTPRFDLTTFFIVLVTIMMADQVGSLIILGVIKMHGAALTRTDLIETLVPALAITVVSSAFAMAIVLLIKLGGTLGLTLVAVMASIAALTYCGYAATNRRHQNLALVHDFVAEGVGAESVNNLAENLLTKIRSLLRAGTAELIILDTDRAEESAGDLQAGSPSGSMSRLSVGESGEVSIVHEPRDRTDWVLMRALASNESVLLAENARDGGMRTWLANRGLRDAIVVPLPASDTVSGAVMVSDRLGETATFTNDDVVLLQTLTRHLAVALRSTRLVERLTYDAHHDSLTGLSNRAHLNQQIHLAVSDRSSQTAVLLLDLDRFKEVNDTLGHAAGDRLLIIVAERLRSVVRPDTTVARLGGDEFALLVPQLSGGAEAALALAQRISEALRQPVHFDEAHLSPQASIGVALTGHGIDLLRQADTAMYAAKASDVSSVLYTPEMDRKRLERLALVADLRTALDTDPEQFTVYYQPKVDLGTGEVTSFEALVRWRHPVRGMVSPDDFIPIAESTGLIMQLTPIVLDAALAQCREWTDRGHTVGVAVNLSARNVEDGELPSRVAQGLSKHRVAASNLILEITESSVMGDPDLTVPVLHELNDLGIAISLDDFGTGYSSLSYLQQLPVQEVKIDRSFVEGLASANPASSRALIASITGLGKNLGLRVVAEGVETTAQLTELCELGCDIAQGFYISKPLPPGEVLGWLQSRGKNATPRLRLLALGE